MPIVEKGMTKAVPFSSVMSSTAAQTVTLIVNTPPVANDDNLSTDEDQELSLTDAVGVIANDIDAEGDTLSVTVISEPTNGIINQGNNGSLSYVPNPYASNRLVELKNP